MKILTSSKIKTFSRTLLSVFIALLVIPFAIAAQDLMSSSDGIWTQNSDASIYYSNGNVGIGTTSPTAKLVVNEPSDGVEIRIDGNNGLYGLYMGADANSPWIGSRTDNDLRIVTNSSEKIRVSTTGNVGIGTTNPTAKLVVNDAIKGTEIRIDGNNGLYGLYMGADSSSPWIGSRTNHDLRIVTNASEKIRVTSSGNVGIGTTNPTSKLDVNGSTNIQGIFTIGGTSTPKIVYPDINITDNGDKSVYGSIAYYLDKMSSTGGMIYLRPGTYTIKQQLVIYSNISIIGSGPSTIIKAADTYSDSDPLILNVGGGSGDGKKIDNVLLQDFAINGNYSVNSTEVDCLEFSVPSATSSSYYSTAIRIKGLDIKNCGRNGMDLGQITNLVLEDLILSNNGYYSVDGPYPDHNIYLSNTEKVRIDNISSTTAKSDGLKIQSSKDVQVNNSVFYKNNGRGVFIGGTSENIILNGLSIHDNGGTSYTNRTDGIQIVDSPSKITIQGSIIENNIGKASGIYIGSSGYGISINGSIIRNNADDGIYVKTISQITVSGNTISGNKDYGIQENAASNEVVVGNNFVNNTTGDSTGTYSVYVSNN